MSRRRKKTSATKSFQTEHDQLRKSILVATSELLKRIRTVHEIYVGLVQIIGRPINSPNDPVSQYIPPGTPPAIAATLNKPQTLFSSDGLVFYTVDFAHVSTMGQLGGAIIDKYKSAGWNVP